MATPKITNTPGAAQSIAAVSVTPDYSRPLTIVTTLFFMWGFLTSLNDILVPHLKSIFELSYARVMLIQFAFFSAYFLFSVPWSKVVNRIGYQSSMVVGLLTMAFGAFLFLPAASAASYPLFLSALVILAAGITGLQVAANPYVVVLGNPETASSRLDLTQAFNSLGTTIAPKLGGLLILSAAPFAVEQLQQLAPQALHVYRVEQAASVKMPYTVIGVALVLLAVLIGSFRLPKIETAAYRPGEKVKDSIWRHPNLLFGAIGIFTYFDRKLPGELFQSARNCRAVRQNRGGLRFVLLGRRNDRTVSRRGTSAAVQARVSVGALRDLCGGAGDSIHAAGRTHGDVDHSCRRPLQLHHVPHHLQPGRRRTWSFDGKWIRHPEYGYRGWRNPACDTGLNC